MSVRKLPLPSIYYISDISSLNFASQFRVLFPASLCGYERRGLKDVGRDHGVSIEKGSNKKTVCF